MNLTPLQMNRVYEYRRGCKQLTLAALETVFLTRHCNIKECKTCTRYCTLIARFASHRGAGSETPLSLSAHTRLEQTSKYIESKVASAWPGCRTTAFLESYKISESRVRNATLSLH